MLVPFLLLISLASPGPTPAIDDVGLESALARAGDHRGEIEATLAAAPEDQREALRWLVVHMPDRDLRQLDRVFLLENCALAHEAWRAAPWAARIPEAIFRDSVLPYASINERRDRWRADFRKRFTPLVAEAKTPAEAAVILNREIFARLGVKYSTKRPKPDQSPLESIESGLASCTGLAVLLIDACRSVGVPARFVGTPLWADGSGNHSWVEIWDDGWHFTGAAEPTGDALDRAWFTDRTSRANREDPRHAIYATTWRRTPLAFPLVWQPTDRSVSAVDVTDRYTQAPSPLSADRGEVRIRVIDPRSGDRVAAKVRVSGVDGGGPLYVGTVKDERFDANDHVTVPIPIGQEVVIVAQHDGRHVQRVWTVEAGTTLVTLTLPASSNPPESTGSASPELAPLREAIAEGIELSRLAEVDGAKTPLSAAAVVEARELLWAHHSNRLRHERAAEHEARELVEGELRMPYWFQAYGEPSERGRSLWISMHGGGGTTSEVNDGQWQNQKRLYQPEEGIYLAPRGPTDTWNLWHQSHIDRFFDRLIENCILFEGVSPDRVFLLGYSAGGDGVYQLAPRMADRWAAAAMMAGHPNDARPEGLRNTAFTLHVGAEDGAYRRNTVGREWGEKLAALRASDPEGYHHWVEIHEGKGHWMEKQDAAALPWMAKHTRDLRPSRVIWLQDDVVHRRFYWLAVDDPQKGQRLVVERRDQEVIILEAEGLRRVRIRLDDRMVDLDQELTVRRGSRVLFRGVAPRTVATMTRTLAERGDPGGIFSAEVVVDLGPPDEEL